MTARPEAETRAAHTPTPWEVRPHSRHVYVGGEDGANVCSCGEPRASKYVGYTDTEIGSPGLHEAVANAAFIVRAANAHDKMLAALKRILAHPKFDACPCGKPGCATFDARAAIALAEGEAS
jgi:hypothetical protein